MGLDLRGRRIQILRFLEEIQRIGIALNRQKLTAHLGQRFFWRLVRMQQVALLDVMRRYSHSVTPKMKGTV